MSLSTVCWIAPLFAGSCYLTFPWQHFGKGNSCTSQGSMLKVAQLVMDVRFFSRDFFITTIPPAAFHSLFLNRHVAFPRKILWRQDCEEVSSNHNRDVEQWCWKDQKKGGKQKKIRKERRKKVNEADSRNLWNCRNTRGPNQIGINSFYGNRINSPAPLHYSSLKERKGAREREGGGNPRKQQKHICLRRPMLSIQQGVLRGEKKLSWTPDTNTVPQTQACAIFTSPIFWEPTMQRSQKRGTRYQQKSPSKRMDCAAFHYFFY